MSSSSPNQLSFLPEDYLERKTQRKMNVVCATVFAVVVTGIAGTFLAHERGKRELDAREATVTTEYEQAARRIEQVKQMQEKQRQMAHQAELASSLLEKVPRGNVLANLTNNLPAGVSLLDLSLDSHVRATPQPVYATKFEKKQAELRKTKALPEIQAKVYDVRMLLSGVAFNDLQVAQYVTKLSSCSLFRDVNLIVVEEHKLDDQQLRKFQIEMTVNPDANVNLEPRTKTAAVELNR